MKTRFPKVWCDACKSMQFAGECPHPRVVDGRDRRAPWKAEALRMTAGDVAGEELRRVRGHVLTLPEPTRWKVLEVLDR